jgi:Nif-specific regulatory protein
LPVTERLLSHGDEVKIGGSLFVYLEEEGSPAVPDPVSFENSGSVTDSVVLHPKESIYSNPEKLADLLSFGARRSVELHALLEIAREIHSLDSLAALQKRLMEAIFDVTPAQRGALLLLADDQKEFASSFGWDRDDGETPAPPLSRAAVERVMRERVAVWNGAPDGNATIVVPLLSGPRLVGVIALESSGPAAPFDDDHLQLVAAIAALAGAGLESARRLEWLESENRRLQEQINTRFSMVGESACMREVFRQISRAAPSEATILILGESGTGKELVARAIHADSPRSAKPFVAINCATLSESLLESELFGHEKGAFTGAVAQKRGKMEMAEGGTLFLDEVGELSPLLQAKLLRVLQEREFERVGGTRPIRVNLRLIAATNRDLESAVKAGIFRQDLYYRLHVIRIAVPTLRERRQDIPLLASYFLSRSAEKSPRRIAGISPAARACLAAYDWPGNVRELENAIERAVVLGSSDLIEPEDLPEAIVEGPGSPVPAAGPYHEAVKEAKKRLILQAVEQAGGSQLQAAQLLGLNPTYLSRLIRNLDLKQVLKAG